MTPQEVIKTLEVAKAEIEWNYPMDYAVAIDEAIEAIDKQIAKKPIVNSGEPLNIFRKYRCSACGARVGEQRDCIQCGQAIDWEVEE